MYWTMLRRELLGRKRQTVILAAGLAIAIALVIVVSSLSSGVRQAQAEALESVYGVGTDLTVTGAAAQPGEGGGGPRFEFDESAGETSDGTTTLSQSRLMSDPMRGELSADTVDTIASLDGVAAATGTLSLTNTAFSGEMPDPSQMGSQGEQGAPGEQGTGGPPSGGPDGAGGSAFDIDSFSVLGVDPEATTLGPLSSVEVTDGRALAAADDGEAVALVDASYAESEEIAVGDSIDVGGTEVEVVGIIASTSEEADTAANVFLPLETARAAAGVEDVISTVYVSAASAADIDAVQAAVEEALPDATVSSQADLASQVSGSLSSASSLISGLGTWLSIIVLAVALGISMLLTGSGVARRTREFGTLKAIGWSNRRVVSQIAGESAVQALIGGAAGLVLGLGAIGIINLIAPTISSGSAGAGGADAAAGGAGASGAPGGGLGGEMMPGGGPGMGGAGMGGSGSGATMSDIVLHAPVTPWIVAAALGLALIGGLVAGAFGAWRAARLSPVAALRAVA